MTKYERLVLLCLACIMRLLVWKDASDPEYGLKVSQLIKAVEDAAQS